MAAYARVLGVLAGEDTDPTSLRSWAASAELVIAADRGADLLLSAGARPHVVVGDMDSISEAAREAAQEVRVMADQETTDCDKLLSVASEIGLPAITLSAIEGDLPDHALATLHSAARSCLTVRFAYRRGVGWLLKGPAETEVRSVPGRRVSLLPITECSGVELEGVTWPLRSKAMHPTGLASVSNRVSGDVVRVRLDSGAALLFVEFPPPEVPFW